MKCAGARLGMAHIQARWPSTLRNMCQDSFCPGPGQRKRGARFDASFGTRKREIRPGIDCSTELHSNVDTLMVLATTSHLWQKTWKKCWSKPYRLNFPCSWRSWQKKLGIQQADKARKLLSVYCIYSISLYLVIWWSERFWIVWKIAKICLERRLSKRSKETNSRKQL